MDLLPRVVATLQPWAEISERLRRYNANLQTVPPPLAEAALTLAPLTRTASSSPAKPEHSARLQLGAFSMFVAAAECSQST